MKPEELPSALPFRIRQESMQPKNPKSGDLLVWHFYERLAMQHHYLYPVTSPEQAMEVIDCLADMQVNDESVACNAFGLEVFDGVEWVEWDDNDGNDINELMRAKEDEE